MKHISTAKVIKSTVYGFLFSLITHFVFWAVFILLYRNVSDIASLLSATVLMVISICIYCDVRENCDRSIAFVGGTLLTHVLLVLLVNWLISLMEAHWLWPISISLGIGYGSNFTYFIVSGWLLFALAAVLVFDLIRIAIRSIRSARKSRPNSV